MAIIFCNQCKKPIAEGARMMAIATGGYRHYAPCPSEEAKEDMVHHPSHYASGGIECIDAITEAVKGLDGIEAMDTGNAIKYLWRWKRKGGKQDLEKARWYIDHLINKL